MKQTAQVDVIFEASLAAQARRSVRRFAIIFLLFTGGLFFLLALTWNAGVWQRLGPLILLPGPLCLAFVSVRALAGPVVRVYGDGRLWLRTSLDFEDNSTLSLGRTLAEGWTVERSFRSNRFEFRKKVLLFNREREDECVLSVQYLDDSELERLLELSEPKERPKSLTEALEW